MVFDSSSSTKINGSLLAFGLEGLKKHELNTSITISVSCKMGMDQFGDSYIKRCKVSVTYLS